MFRTLVFAHTLPPRVPQNHSVENSRPFEDVVFEGMHRANRLMSCRRKAFKAEAKTKLGEVPQAQELSHEEQFNSIYHRDILR